MPIRMIPTHWKSFSLVVDGRHCSPLSTLKLPVSYLVARMTLANAKLFSSLSSLFPQKKTKANARSNPPPTSSFNNLGIDSPAFAGPSTESSAPPSGPDSVGAGAGAGAGGGRERVCPHCTFVNEHGGSDCEICGLPLDG